MPAIQDQKPVETFAPGRANLTLHVGICPWRRDRRRDHLEAFRLEDKIGATAVLGVVIVDQELRAHTELGQLPADIPGLLCHPGRVWAVGHREPDHPPAEFIKEIDICNTAQVIVKAVTQRIVQGTALDFFWRYFPKN